MLDLDRLEAVNDRTGHVAGDAPLPSAASCLDSLLPSGSLLARLELAHGLRRRLVAEGVGDAATLRALEALGCDESQGFLHARPQPTAAVAAGTPHSTRVPSLRGAPL